MEYLCLEEILKHFRYNKIQQTQENILMIYDALVEVSSGMDMVIPLGKLSQDMIAKFLKEHEHNLATIENICVAELIS